MEQPVGFFIARKVHKMLKLQKALYGLHGVSRAWNAKLDNTLVSLGFRRSTLKHTINIRQNCDTQLVVSVYVDDLVITGTSCDGTEPLVDTTAYRSIIGSIMGADEK
jgi:hypothetical protein